MPEAPKAHVCPECDGKGEILGIIGENKGWIALHCSNCDGKGVLDEHGEPVLKEETPCPSNSTTTKSPESYRS